MDYYEKYGIQTLKGKTIHYASETEGYDQLLNDINNVFFDKGYKAEFYFGRDITYAHEFVIT